MTHKDYKIVASTIKWTIENGTLADAETMGAHARNLSDRFKAHNSHFRYDHFFAACGLDKWGHPTA